MLHVDSDAAMAKQGAKRRVEDNKKRLGLLLQAIIAANVRLPQVWAPQSLHLLYPEL